MQYRKERPARCVAQQKTTCASSPLFPAMMIQPSRPGSNSEGKRGEKIFSQTEYNSKLLYDSFSLFNNVSYQ